MIGRHRVARRLINVYWGTTLNCILPTKAAGAQARNQDSNQATGTWLTGMDTLSECQSTKLSNYQDNPDSHEMDTPALRGVNNTGGSTQRQLVSYEQFNNSTQTALDRASDNPSRQLLTQPLTAPLPGGMATQLSQEMQENDLQTDQENHLHSAPPQHPSYHSLPPHSDE